MTPISKYLIILILLLIPFLLRAQCPNIIMYSGNKLKLVFDPVPDPIPEFITYNGIEYTIQQSGNSGNFFTEATEFNESISNITLTINYQIEESSCSFIDGVLDLSLPVELIDYSSELIDNDILLEWSTLNEKNNAGFEIEYSFDGSQFENLGMVNGVGDNDTLQTYAFWNKGIRSRALGNTVYYRLVQIDYNGTKTYMETLAVDLGLNFEQFEITKITGWNTLEKVIKVYYFVPIDVQKINFLLVDINSRIIERRSVYPESGLNFIKFDLSGQKSPFYFLALNNGKEIISKKIVLALDY